MDHETGRDGPSELSIRVPIPAGDDDLYAHGATDDVLAFLARNRHESFTQRAIAERVGHSHTSVGRAVAVLEANGLLGRDRRGNRALVEIDRDRLAAPDDPILEIPQAEFREPVRVAVAELREAIDDVVAIVCYGSVARGDADRRSDVDLWILVEGDRAASQREANAAVDALEERRFDGDRYRFHVVVESVDSVPSFTEDVEAILGSGISLYASPAFETFETVLAGGDE